MTQPASPDGGVSTSETLSVWKRLRSFSPTLVFMTFYLSMAAFNFGYDQGNFSGLQAMNYFDKEFGEYDPKKKHYVLPSYLQSVMTSTPYIGKLLGCWICTPVTERLGRKKMILIIVLLSYVATTLQISATTAAQFTVGRIVAYFMTGFTVSVVPVYLAECAPPELRGLIGSQLQFQIVFSIMIASFVNLGASNMNSPVQWKVTVAVGFLMPSLLLACWYWVRESPRWLISKGRQEEAIECLRYFRKEGTSIDTLRVEIETIAQLGNEGKGTWKDVFNKANRKRTGIACFVMLGQQITGQVFGSQYGTFFYKSQGIPNPFLIQCISNIVALCSLFIGALVVDGLGRRFVLFLGGTLQGVFMFALGGMGTIKDIPHGVKYLMVAFLILDGAAYNISWGPLSYLTISEVSNSRVREKTAMLAVSVSIVTAFIVSFTLPYLMNAPYGNLGAKVGFIYGSIAITMVILAWFIVPELKGRTLEEVDELFASRINVRQFKSTVIPATTVESILKIGADKNNDYEVEGRINQVEVAGGGKF